MPETTKANFEQTIRSLERRFNVNIAVSKDASRIKVVFNDPVADDTRKRDEPKVPNGMIGIRDATDTVMYRGLYDAIKGLGYTFDSSVCELRLPFRRHVRMDYSPTFLRNGIRDLAEWARMTDGGIRDRAREAEEQRLAGIAKTLKERYGAELTVISAIEVMVGIDKEGVVLSKDRREAQIQIEQLMREAWGGIEEVLTSAGYHQRLSGAVIFSSDHLWKPAKAKAIGTTFIRTGMIDRPNIIDLSEDQYKVIIEQKALPPPALRTEDEAR